MRKHVMVSGIASWGRLVSVAGIAALAVAYLGSTSALATGQAPVITSDPDGYFHVGVPTTFTVTTTGSPVPAITESGAIPAGITFVDNHDGTATISGTAPAGAEGHHALTITAANGVAPNAVQAFDLEVGSVISITSAPSTTFIEGESGTFAVTATTVGCDPTTWTVTGSLPAGVTFTGKPGTPGSAAATLAGTPGAGTAGSWPFTITLISAVCGPATQSFTLTVSPPLVVTSTVFSASEGITFNGKVGSFTGGKAPYTATISWGDGTSSAGAISGGNEVSGAHTFAEEGSTSVTLSVTDAGTTKSSTLAEMVVDGQLVSSVVGSQPIAANEGTAFSGVVGSFGDADPGAMATDYTATIAWGDGQTSSGTIVAGGGAFTVTGTHSYLEHGAYSGTVTYTDAGGSTAANSFTATIAEAPLTVAVQNISPTAGASFSGQVATFTDPGGKEPITEYEATINWGDGTTTTGTVADPPGVFTVSGTHTYAASGTYTVTVSARESDVTLFAVGTGSASVAALPLTSAPWRPLPTGLFLILAGLLLAGTGAVARQRRRRAGPVR